MNCPYPKKGGPGGVEAFTFTVHPEAQVGDATNLTDRLEQEQAAHTVTQGLYQVLAAEAEALEARALQAEADNAALLQALLDCADMTLSARTLEAMATTLRAETHPGAALLARLHQTERERDAARAEALRLLADVEAWKSATGLERGGDPDAVTPQGLAQHLTALEDAVTPFLQLALEVLGRRSTVPIQDSECRDFLRAFGQEVPRG